MFALHVYNPSGQAIVLFTNGFESVGGSVMLRLLALLVSFGALVHAQGTAVQMPFPGGTTGSVWGSGQPPSPQAPTRDRRADEIKPGTAAIRGQVVAADTGVPLRRAQIRVFNTGGPGGGGMAQTDAQGRFELTQLPAGRYNISASRAGYVTMQLGQRAPNQPGTPLELADARWPTRWGSRSCEAAPSAGESPMSSENRSRARK